MHEKDRPAENGELGERGEARVEAHGEEGPAHQVGPDHVHGQPGESEARLRGAHQLLQSTVRGEQGQASKKQARAQIHAEGIEDEVALGFKTAEHGRRRGGLEEQETVL